MYFFYRISELRKTIDQLNNELLLTQKKNEDAKYRFESEKFLLEKKKLKNENLKKVIEDLKNQREGLEKQNVQEREISKNQSRKIDELQTNQKKV